MDSGERDRAVLVVGLLLGLLVLEFLERRRHPKPNLQFLPVSVTVA